MYDLAVIVAVECALLAAIIFLREPKLLIPAVVIGLTFEYAETQALGRLGSGGATGAIRALLNPGKAAMVATVIVVLAQRRHRLSSLFPDSSLLLPVFALSGLLVIGLAWSDSLRPPNSILILPLYVAFIVTAPALIEDRRDLERIAGAFFLATIALSVVAIAQRNPGVFHWRAILVNSDEYAYRSNATFADPNNLARFLVVSMSLAAGMVLATGARRLTVYLAAPSFALGALGIVLTGSRSGWMMLLLVGFIVVLTAPIARYTKVKLTAAAVAAVVAMVALLLAQGGANAERVRSLTSGVDAIGQREFLIRAGLHMWRDNPLIGVGTGNYQHALVLKYFSEIPSWAKTTLSHTSAVSVLAELGIVGALMYVLVGVRIGIAVVATYWRTTVPFNRLMTGWIGASLVGILFISQSEGRLIEEPYLWLLMALLIAIETGPLLAGRREPATAAESAAPVTAPVAESAAGRGRRAPAGVAPSAPGAPIAVDERPAL
ncbi:MAG: O-antigen ligase family protein [Chloroflexi bacterium]|nr:O-antigen ligase family protein [Chloroflexota bacterium]